MSDEPNPRRHPNLVNVAEAPSHVFAKGDRFACTIRPLGREAGGRGVGCSWFEVPPGRAATPLHYHCNNEEALFVLEGEGLLRIGDESVRVGPGDYVSFAAGPERAHQLVNTGAGPLRYLCLSTLVPDEVVGYPESGKIAALASQASDDRGAGWLASWFLASSAVEPLERDDPER
jgi:uncharacterized cupin superfamily protein